MRIGKSIPLLQHRREGTPWLKSTAIQVREEVLYDMRVVLGATRMREAMYSGACCSKNSVSSVASLRKDRS